MARGTPTGESARSQCSAWKRSGVALTTASILHSLSMTSTSEYDFEIEYLAQKAAALTASMDELAAGDLGKLLGVVTGDAARPDNCYTNHVKVVTRASKETTPIILPNGKYFD